MKTSIGALLSVVAFLATGCDDVIDLDPLDERTPIQPRVRAKPIIGGTLEVTPDRLAIAADPDRDLIHIADIDLMEVLHTVSLEDGDEPGRITLGDDGMAYVVLRGSGKVAALDIAAGTITATHSVCNEPRGIDFDELESSLFVACADGNLVTLDADSGTLQARDELTPDLRDVVMVGGVRYVSQFRATDLVGQDGSKRTLPHFNEQDFFNGSESERIPNVAWRTREMDDGDVIVLHQLSSTEEVPLEPRPEGDDVETSPYGGGGSFCSPGISEVAVSIVSSGSVQTVTVPDAPLTVDADMSPGNDWIALAMPGAPEGEPTVGLVDRDFGCEVVDPGPVAAQVTAVAFADEGELVMFGREPAQIIVTQFPGGTPKAIELTGESVYDTGHEIFHRATESGLSCATCHPEGTDDGFVWRFESLGPRRTQPLDVGLEGTAPFHWDGDMGDMSTLMGEVLAHRMGGKRQSAPRQESFQSWVFAQARPSADNGLQDATLVAQGQQLFKSYECGTCHTGDKLGGDLTTPVRGMPLQVPSLRRVSLRPPFMHDGRSKTIDDAVVDMIVSTTATNDPPDEDVDALVAYMNTL